MTIISVENKIEYITRRVMRGIRSLLGGIQLNFKEP